MITITPSKNPFGQNYLYNSDSSEDTGYTSLTPNDKIDVNVEIEQDSDILFWFTIEGKALSPGTFNYDFLIDGAENGAGEHVGGYNTFAGFVRKTLVAGTYNVKIRFWADGTNPVSARRARLCVWLAK